MIKWLKDVKANWLGYKL